MNPFSSFLISLIKLYRKWLSPLKPYPTCKYLPTCSHYAIDAIKNRGVIEGGAYATWRVLRCNPFSKGGYDPPPPVITDRKKARMHKFIIYSFVITAVLITAFGVSAQEKTSDMKVSASTAVKTPVAKKTTKSMKTAPVKDSTAIKTAPVKDSTAIKTAPVKDSAAIKTAPVKDSAAVKNDKNSEQAKIGKNKNAPKQTNFFHSLKYAPSSIPAQKDKRMIYENSLYRAVLTEYGGVFTSFTFKKSQYKEKTITKENLKRQKKIFEVVPIDMIKTWSYYYLPFLATIDIEKQAESLDDYKIFHVSKERNGMAILQKWNFVSRKEKGDTTEIILKLETEHACKPDEPAVSTCFPAEIYKVYEFHKNRYDVNLNFLIKNISKAPIKIKQLTVQVTSLHEGESSRGFFNPVSVQKEAICYHVDGVSVQPFKTIMYGGSSGGCMGGCTAMSCSRTPSKSSVFPQGARWAGIDARYFLMVAIKNYTADDGGCKFMAQEIKNMSGYGLITALMESGVQRVIKPSSDMIMPFKLYIGPKDMNYLKEVKISEAIPKNNKLNEDTDPQLTKSVDFGILGIIGKPLIWALKLVYRFLGNWGLAIIFITILIKIMALHWTTKSMRSMKKMAKLKPEIDELQKLYKNDKEQLNKEIMALYKKHGVNPISGCLPMFIQMPIYIAWYQALMASVEIYRAPLFGWISDLTARDPYFILPLLMGIIMFIQQKITPTTGDSQQAKIMLYFMPIMFTTIMLFLPAGLTLYILTNSFLSLVHQWYMNHTEDA